MLSHAEQVYLKLQLEITNFKITEVYNKTEIPNPKKILIFWKSSIHDLNPQTLPWTLHPNRGPKLSAIKTEL